MNKRPIPVTIISWIYLLTGVVGLAYHATEIKWTQPLADDGLWVCLTRALAIVAGAFMLRGWNWARWLSIAWIAWHVYLSLFHPIIELIMHALLLAAFTFFLFRPQASAYFRTRQAGADTHSK